MHRKNHKLLPYAWRKTAFPPRPPTVMRSVRHCGCQWRGCVPALSLLWSRGTPLGPESSGPTGTSCWGHHKEPRTWGTTVTLQDNIRVFFLLLRYFQTNYFLHWVKTLSQRFLIWKENVMKDYGRQKLLTWLFPQRSSNIKCQSDWDGNTD